MAENSNIQWTNNTGGPWLICTEVSPGCANCYARELMLTRLAPIVRKAYRKAGFADWETRPIWGDNAPRVLSKSFWNDARAAQRKLERMDNPPALYWFPSLIDWLDAMPAGIIDQDGNWLDPIEVLARFLGLIRETPLITWQLLTKRVKNWWDRLTELEAESFQWGTDTGGKFGDWVARWVIDRVAPHNIWIGTTVEDQQRADERIPHLLKIPAKVRFLSVEPMLGPVAFSQWLDDCNGVPRDYPFDWVIFGGESGTKARPCNVDWIRSGVRQCQTAGVKVFVKQLGSNPVHDLPANSAGWRTIGTRLTNRKGGDPSEWPEDLRVREFPAA